MPVSLDEARETIVLAEACVVEEAEALNQLLQDHPEWPVDASECEYLHTAVLQVLMSRQPKWTGLPKPPHLRRAMAQIFQGVTHQTESEGGEQS